MTLVYKNGFIVQWDTVGLGDGFERSCDKAQLVCEMGAGEEHGGARMPYKVCYRAANCLIFAGPLSSF